MQALWSRAAQARTSCQCSSCLHGASAIARRTTTATSKRRLKLGDLFTACYSTIIATAVFADARVKEDRRKEWDRIIAEAKAGMPVDETAAPKITHGQQKAEKLGLDLIYYPRAVRRAPWTASNHRPPNPKSGYLPQVVSLGCLDNQLKSFARSTEECDTVADASPTSSAGQHEDWFDVDDFEARPSPNFSPREPFNKAHLNKMGEMVRNLIDRLLLKADIFSSTETASISNTSLEAQKIDIAQRIGKMRTSFTRLPAYSWESNSSIRQEQRTALHKSILTLCAKTIPDPNTKPDRSSVELLVAKICYNLLISTTPPNIGTYNILIRELTRLEQHDLAQSVVDSFLHDCVMKPNERTIKLILDHYHAKKDSAGFQDTINRMRSYGGHMHVESKPVYALASPAVRRWAVSNRIGQHGAWLFQKVDRTPAIFESLFRGSFDLKGLRATIRFIRAALREGQTVPVRVIYRVVEACVAQMDYKAARRLLKVLVLAWKTDSISIINLSPDFRRAFHQLLALCNIYPASDSHPVLSPSISHYVVHDMLRWIRIQSIEDSINRVQYVISSLAITLDIPFPRASGPGERPVPYSRPGKSGVPTAVKILRDASGREKRREARKRRAEKASSFRLKMLKTEINDIFIRTANIARDIQSFHVRQSRLRARWQTIRDIEAAIKVQTNLVIIREYELLSFLSTGLPVWHWNKLISRFQEAHGEGLLVHRPLRFILRLFRQVEESLPLLERSETTCQNQSDGVQVQHQPCSHEDTKGNLENGMNITENASKIPKSHGIRHEASEPHPRSQPPSPAEPHADPFNIPSLPAVVLPRPGSPLLLSSPTSYDTFKCIEGRSGANTFT